MLGKKLKELRENIKLSQSEVARRLNISRQSYNFYENNKREPDLYLIKKIALFFDVSTDYLLNLQLEQQDVPLRNTEENTTDEMVKIINTLSPEDKKTLKKFIRFLAYSRNETQ